MIGFRRVLKAVYIYFMASLWIGSWGLLAVDEVTTSIEYLLEKNNAPISSVLQPGYVMHEKNGVKFMIKQETAEALGVVTLDMECDSPEFWDNIEYEVDLETLEFVVDFNKLNYRDYKIQDLYVITEPYSPDAADWHINTKGFEYYNFTKTLVPHNDNVAKVSLPLYKSNFASVEKTYPLHVKLEATAMNTYNPVACVKEDVTMIPSEKFKDFKDMEPFFVDGIFQPYDIENLQIDSVEEDAFISKFMEYQKMRKSGLDLPSLEAGLALLGKDLTFSSNLDSDYVWIKEPLKNKRIRTKKTVLGLYGDVLKSDLEDVKKVIEVLHVVAPGLDISYSSETKDVTLPIHITECKDKLGKHIGCEDGGWAGVYMWEDFIWMDGSQRGDYRSHILIHEIGHALGLGHNLCWTSAMTYEKMGPNVPYFSHIDLMQLQILYNPVFQNKYYHSKNSSYLSRYKVINDLKLSEERVLYYEENIEEACYQQPGAYDHLIDMQVGNK
jgi:hypothetical protein